MEKRSQIEQQVVKLEKIQRINGTTIAYVCNFITKPGKLWRDAGLKTRQAFQKIMFPKGLHFDIVERKFGMEVLSSLRCYLQQKRVKL